MVIKFPKEKMMLVKDGILFELLEVPHHIFVVIMEKPFPGSFEFKERERPQPRASRAQALGEGRYNIVPDIPPFELPEYKEFHYRSLQIDGKFYAFKPFKLS